MQVQQKHLTISALHASDEGGNVNYGPHAGLSIRLYHPDSAPFDTSSFLDDSGSYNLRTSSIEVCSSAMDVAAFCMVRPASPSARLYGLWKACGSLSQGGGIDALD